MELLHYRTSCLPDDPRYIKAANPLSWADECWLLSWVDWSDHERDPWFVGGLTEIDEVPEQDWGKYYRPANLAMSWEDYPPAQMPAVPHQPNWQAVPEIKVHVPDESQTVMRQRGRPKGSKNAPGKRGRGIAILTWRSGIGITFT